MTTTGVGIAGWGIAGRLMAEALDRSEDFALVAVADRDPIAASDARRDGVRTVVSDLAALLELPMVEVVYIALPTPLHHDAVVAAARARKAIIVEKPLARNVAEAVDAVAAAKSAGVALVVGATRSMDAPVVAVRQVVEDGRLGRLLSVSNVCGKDWLSRPRSPAELDAASGGGVVFRQGGHQFDVLRYIAGGLATELRAETFGGVDGHELGYSALVTFANGVVASAIYHGAGGFDSRSLTFGVGELGERVATPLGDGGVTPEFPIGSFPPHFGFTLASFEGGDVVPGLRGVRVVRPGTAPEDLTVDANQSGWDALLERVAYAIVGTPVTQDGAWGLATLELCAAVHESTCTHRSIDLHHQVATDPQTRIGACIDH